MLSNIISCIVGLTGGGITTWLVARWYYIKGKDEETARYVVLAMLRQHPVEDSRELQERIDQYLDALKRTKKDKRGVPIYREDGSIGVDWSLDFREKMGLR